MKYARIFLKGSDNPLRWIDYPVGDQGFANFIISCRMQGCVMPLGNFGVYLPWDEIKVAVEVDTSNVEAIRVSPFAGMIQEGSKPN